MVFGWAPEATIGARISSPSASVTPIVRPSRRRSTRRRRRSGSRRPRLGRAGERLADRAHAADHLAPAAGDPVDLAERVVEQVVRGARGAGPAQTPTTPVEAIEPLSPSCSNRSSSRSATDIVKMRIRSWRSRRLEPGGAAALAKQPEQVAGIARAERRGLAEHHRTQEGGPVEQVLEALVRLAVALRERRDRGRGPGRLVEEEDRPVGRHRGVGGIERDRSVAVVAKAQVRRPWLEHRDHVAGARDPAPGQPPRSRRRRRGCPRRSSSTTRSPARAS